MSYGLFLSSARKDNQPIPETYPRGWVAAIYERILHGLRESKMPLVCLSPNYFGRAPCRWEWEEYVKRQDHALLGSESVAPVYFVEVPGSDEQAKCQVAPPDRSGGQMGVPIGHALPNQSDRPGPCGNNEKRFPFTHWLSMGLGGPESAAPWVAGL